MAVLDRLRINLAVIGGESIGAGIALALWRRHRQRVRALILSWPAWRDAFYPPNLAIRGTIARLIDDFGRGQGMARALPEAVPGATAPHSDGAT